jgi:hypothetical protein
MRVKIKMRNKLDGKKKKVGISRLKMSMITPVIIQKKIKRKRPKGP